MPRGSGVRTVLDIYFGVTDQLVYFDAPEGRPSSVTSIEVQNWYAGDDATAESATGSASVEANPNTTLDASAGPGESDPRNIPVAATTGVAVGRRYLLTSVANGLKEWIDVESFVSADKIGAKHPLINTYASSDTLQSTRIQATVDSTWVADLANLDSSSGANAMYRVRWVYVVSSVTYVAESYFNLVRYIGAHGVRPADIEALVPGWLDSLPLDHRKDQGRTLIDQAHRDVKMDLLEINVDDSAVAQTEVVDDLVRFKAIELGEWARAVSSESEGTGRFDLAAARYQKRLDALVRITSKVPIRDTTASANSVTALPAWSK